MISHKIAVTGIVQGIGFRPFIYNLAQSLQLTGYVHNSAHGVEIVIQGPAEQIDQFEKTVQNAPPPHSRIDHFECDESVPNPDFTTFTIAASQSDIVKSAQVSPDLDVCPDCLREMRDPTDRRYEYPFINCTNCGPRFSLIQDVPYDRPLTTMQAFRMCPECQREYDTPSNRRFHAQPNACPVCGPRLILTDSRGRELLTGGTAEANITIFTRLARLLTDGRIIAIKSIGGFHLACDARNESAVANLRRRKFREDRPFAIMFPSLESIRSVCELQTAEEVLLTSTAHPIVLLRRLPENISDSPLAPSAAPDNQYLGAMLAYSPLHHLVLQYFPYAIVLTSGNVSDEPIAYKNDNALSRLAEIADYFLLNDREIHIRCDDSVYRIWNDRPYPIRRSRGFAPLSIPVAEKFAAPVLACGPEQKNTFALAKDDHVFLSQHTGDLVNYEVLRSFGNGISHYKNLFDIEPKVIAYDLHPDYLSTKFALDYPQTTPSGQPVTKIGIQHHHAHAVACLAENNISEPAIGIILDGTGYGTDGTIWGGEILLVEARHFERLGHFQSARLPGGAAAIKNPWQMAVSYLYETYGEELSNRRFPFLTAIPPEQVEIVLNMLKSGFNAPWTTSCGRLFDGVAALAGLRNQVNYEGQAAVEFEQCVADTGSAAYDFEIETRNGRFVIVWQKMIRQVIHDVENNNRLNRFDRFNLIAGKFHNGLAEILFQAARTARKMTGLSIIALSGGVFMNVHLLTRLHDLLKADDFTVCTHHLTPCNDGGIAFGQAVIANAIYQSQNHPMSS